MLTYPSSFPRRFVLASAAALFFAGACGSPDDPQLGEEGRVRFVAGRGCTSSTILAVGSTATVRLESATEDQLPAALGVTSQDSSVITARMGLEPATIDLNALKQGQSRIEITTDGEAYDGLVFTAAPATRVSTTGEPRVFAGGAVDVIVNDVTANCEEGECQVLGQGFLGWRVEPPEQASFVLDFQGAATFRAKAAGQATIVGTEPVTKKDIVSHALEIVPAASATKLAALLFGKNFDPEKPSTFISLPGSLPRPDAISVSVIAETMDGGTINISRRDVVWRVQGEELVIEAPDGDNRDATSTNFLTAGTGKVTLVAEVKMLMMEQAFELNLTSP
jgi:hypothetical protein